jgi:hypothetical protein
MTLRFQNHCPRPEEPAPAGVSKDGSGLTGPSFETQTASAPQDEDSAGTGREHFTEARIRIAVERAAEPKNGDESTPGKQL